MNRLFILFLTLFICASARAQGAGDVYIVSSPSTRLYLSPEEGNPTSIVLARGRRVVAAGEKQNGFIPLSTKSGSKAWVHASDLKPELASASDVVEPAGSPDRPARGRAPRHPSLGLEKLTFDLGASSGSYGGISYTEIDLGLNAYFTPYLAWRNAVFGRYPSVGTSLYGWDTSVRGILDINVLTAFAGPGYRFVSQGPSAPFAEAGLVFKLGGIALGGGVKDVLTSWVQPGAPNDTQYFFILAGGGAL